MDKDLIIVSCSFLLPEIYIVISEGDYPDVDLQSFKANCSENAYLTKRVQEIFSRSKEQKKDVIFIGGSCQSINKISPENVTALALEQDFEMFMNPETIKHYLTNGYYIVTNGWLRSVDQHIKCWGFNTNDAKLFFQESMKGIMCLDTQIPGDFMPNLEKLSAYMGLPFEILPVGLSHCKDKIDNIVIDWRQKVDRKILNEKLSESSRKSADYSLIFHQLEMLVELTDEDEIIQLGLDLLNVLYAPKALKYIKLIGDEEKCYALNASAETLDEKLKDPFKIEISQGDVKYGIFEVFEFKFPQHKDKYYSLGHVISQIFSLSIANARRFRTEINQKEKIEEYAKDLKEINLTKDKFFSIVAHDLKGPFNAIIGLSDFILDDLDSNDYDHFKKLSEIINRTSKQTFALLSNLLEWSRSQTGKIQFEREELNLFDLSNEVIEVLKIQADEKDLSIKINIASDVKVNGDKNMLKVILRNLITNAIKYSYDEGKILISHFYEEGMSEISISDSGVGIKPDKINELFKLKHNTSTIGTHEEKGTGLGLILCKEFVEMHQGKIWVESEFGNGSSFHFTLPN